MKQRLKKILVRLGVFEKLKYSPAGRLVQRLFKTKDHTVLQQEILFYNSFLPPCRIIFDIGANDGHKTEAFLRFAKQVVCVEPDARNFSILQERFRHRKARVILENKAVAAHDGESILFIYEPGSAFNTTSSKFREFGERVGRPRYREAISFSDSTKVAAVTLDTLIERYGVPDFIKIDVEGSELSVLKGLHHPVPLISLEYNLPQFQPELLDSIAWLEAMHPGVLTYTIAVSEQLQFAGFQKLEKVNDFLSSNGEETIELIVRNAAAAEVRPA